MKTHIIHFQKSPQEKDTSKILGRMIEKEKLFSSGIFFTNCNSIKTICHKRDYASRLGKIK